MFTTKPSAIADGEATTSTGKKRIPLIWIPATISAGLALAAVYLGGRIVTSHSRSKPAAQVSVPRPPIQQEQAISLPPSSVELPKETVVTPPVVETDEQAITPEVGKLYIQLGALGSKAASRFVQRMRGQQLDAHTAPGPSPHVMRVLIGPFDSSDALEAAKAQLEDQGIAHFVRRY